MISYVLGSLLDKDLDRIEILTAGGVGYEMAIPLGVYEKLPAVGEEAALHTHLVVREDAHMLYGFASEQERHVFRQLLKIAGVLLQGRQCCGHGCHSTRIGASIQGSLTHSQPHGKRSSTISNVCPSTA